MIKSKRAGYGKKKKTEWRQNNKNETHKISKSNGNKIKIRFTCNCGLLCMHDAEGHAAAKDLQENS